MYTNLEDFIQNLIYELLNVNYKGTNIFEGRLNIKG